MEFEEQSELSVLREKKERLGRTQLGRTQREGEERCSRKEPLPSAPAHQRGGGSLLGPYFFS